MVNEGEHTANLEDLMENSQDGEAEQTESSSSPTRPKRKRVITYTQRKAANVRERKRMVNLNQAFDQLRHTIPTFQYEKKLSRIETLRLAITYMGFLGDLLDGKEPTEIHLWSPKRSDDEQM